MLSSGSPLSLASGGWPPLQCPSLSLRSGYLYNLRTQVKGQGAEIQKPCGCALAHTSVQGLVSPATLTISSPRRLTGRC